MLRRAVLMAVLLTTSARAQSPDCAAEIARYRAVQDSDFKSGNVAKSVYAAMQRETAAAEKLCTAGQNAKASEAIRASQARHGYSTHM